MNSLFLKGVSGYILPGPERLKWALNVGWLGGVSICGRSTCVVLTHARFIVWLHGNDLVIDMHDDNYSRSGRARFYTASRAITDSQEEYDILELVFDCPHGPPRRIGIGLCTRSPSGRVEIRPGALDNLSSALKEIRSFGLPRFGVFETLVRRVAKKYEQLIPGARV